MEKTYTNVIIPSGNPKMLANPRSVETGPTNLGGRYLSLGKDDMPCIKSRHEKILYDAWQTERNARIKLEQVVYKLQ